MDKEKNTNHNNHKGYKKHYNNKKHNNFKGQKQDQNPKVEDQKVVAASQANQNEVVKEQPKQSTQYTSPGINMIIVILFLVILLIISTFAMINFKAFADIEKRMDNIQANQRVLTFEQYQENENQQ